MELSNKQNEELRSYNGTANDAISRFAKSSQEVARLAVALEQAQAPVLQSQGTADLIGKLCLPSAAQSMTALAGKVASSGEEQPVGGRTATKYITVGHKRVLLSLDTETGPLVKKLNDHWILLVTPSFLKHKDYLTAYASGEGRTDVCYELCCVAASRQVYCPFIIQADSVTDRVAGVGPDVVEHWVSDWNRQFEEILKPIIDDLRTGLLEELKAI